LQHKQGNKKAEEDANKDAESKVKDIEAAGKKSGDKVVKDLLKAITDVKPEVPDKISVNS
jgi:V-type H+-transporting ATPase subunit G